MLPSRDTALSVALLTVSELSNHSKNSGNAFETAALDTDLSVTLPLADDSNYYWKVIITDANASGDQVTEGNLWTFSTGDAAPIIQAPADQYMWLDQVDGDGDSAVRTFTVTTTYTDDGYSAIAGEPNFVTTDWTYETGQAGVRFVSNSHVADTPDASGALSGTITAVYETVAAPDPLATAFPGWWNFGGLVIDGANETTGPTGFNYVSETCADATVAEGNGNAGGDPDYAALVGDYDVNNDCVNNLEDFAAFAAEWLDVSPKKE